MQRSRQLSRAQTRASNAPTIAIDANTTKTWWSKYRLAARLSEPFKCSIRLVYLTPLPPLELGA
jgi:hypothetical protein